MSNINDYREKILDLLGMNPNIVSAKGNILTTQDGLSFRDCLSQYGALPFGHNPDFAVQVLRTHTENQAPVFSQPIIQNNTEQFAKELIASLGGHYKKCVFTNSGAETVEAAIKLSRLKTRRRLILSATNSFHGKTSSALACTGSTRYTACHLDDDRHIHIPLNDRKALKNTLNSQKFAAFIVEPVQGEGGMHKADPEWLLLAQQLCRKSKTLLIFDEVQTGLGRTGAMTVSSSTGIIPDILLLAKALSAGMVPSGAMLYTSKASCPEFERKHSSTFANNGLAASVGRAMLKQMQKPIQRKGHTLLQHVQHLSLLTDTLCNRLQQNYSGLFSWRGCGLMRSFQFVDSQVGNNYILNYMQNSGTLAWVLCSYLFKRHRWYMVPLMSDPCSIRFEPPLNTSEEDIHDVFRALEDVCELMQKGRYDHLLAHLIDVGRESLATSNQAYPVSRDMPYSPEFLLDEKKTEGKTFAFLIHTTSIADVVRSLPEAIRKNYTQSQKEALAKLIIAFGKVDFSPAVALRFAVSNTQAYANGIMIYSPISPHDMLKLSPAEKHNLLESWLNVARQENVEVVGLGAYSSVISRGGESILEGAQDFTLTTGNSLTAISCTEMVLDMAGHNLLGKKVAVIGARGAVGKLVVSELAHYADTIDLIGRPGSEEAVHKELINHLCCLSLTSDCNALPGSIIDQIRCIIDLPKLTQAGMCANIGEDEMACLARKVAANLPGLSVTSQAELSLGCSDYVIAATSEGKPFLNSDKLKSGGFAIDVARPFDFISSARSKAQVIEGGLVYQPGFHVYGDNNMTGSPPGVNLACLSETIVLALSRVSGHFSIGKSLDHRQAKDILKLALAHDFHPVLWQESKQKNNQLNSLNQNYNQTEVFV